MQTFSAIWSDELAAAIRAAQTEPYTMSLVGDDARAVEDAVNQGIDAHLEACFMPDRGDSYAHKTDESWGIRRLHCSVSQESLPVLVRRLMEAGDESGIASGICETLDIELV